MKYLAVFLLACFSVGPFAATNEVNLFERLFLRDSGTTNHLRDIVDANGTAIVVGDHGTILVSSNLLDWRSVAVPTTNNLRSIAWNTNGFVAVGERGTILTSPNGNAWTLKNSGTTNDLNDVAAGNLFVAVGQNGTVCHSSNGLDWATRRVANGKHLNAVGWGDPRFMAVGEAGTVIASNDGIAWTLHFSGTTEDLLDISEEGWWFVAVGRNGTVIRHTNPNVWEVSNGNTTEDIRGIVHLGVDSLYVEEYQLLIGDASIAEANLHLTPGSSFTDFSYERPSPGTADLRGRINAGLQTRGTTAWVGQDGAIYSGIVWRRVSLPLLFSNVQFLEGRFWGVGGNGSLLTSADGEEWVAKNSGTTNHLLSIAYGNGRFVVGGFTGRTLVSTNGESWVEYPAPRPNLRGGGVTFAEGRFYLGSAGDTFFDPIVHWFHSDDGINWVTNGLEGNVVLIHGNGVFLGVDLDAGRVSVRSETGIDWSDVSDRPTRPAVAFGEGVFSSLNGISTNGLDWTVTEEPLYYRFMKATYGHSHFVGVQAGVLDSVIIASADGLHRVVRPLRTGFTYDFANAVAYGNGRVLVALSSGLYVSEALPPFLEIQMSGRESSVVFHGDGRRTYDLQQSSKLDGDWTTVGGIPVESPVPVDAGAEGRRFFRVVERQ